MRACKRGLTLVEVLVVIVIIGIMAAILLPALSGAIATANNARVASEESNLATALAAFKTKYGEYPPSRIILWNLSAGDPAPYKLSDATPVATGDVTYGDLNRRTVLAMRKYFPRAAIYFPSTGVVSSKFSPSWVWGKTNPIILSGDECLTFFLGGVAQLTPEGNYSPAGFSRDPVNPFNQPPPNRNDSRSNPIYEFAPGRLVDLDGDGFPSFVDPLAGDLRPYAYFSAYGNNGYDPNDCNSNEVDDNGAPIKRMFHTNFSAADGSLAVSSAAPNPYTLGDPNPPLNASGQYIQSAMFQNSQSFQIISAGRDRMWGPGGAFSPTANVTLPTGFPNDPANTPIWRKYERDNVTNLSAGRLD